ncbi:long-chain fatty acid--CoA ligase [Mangrovimicrobium sediminis]|uniref:Long-chain fatty acid--CoA ligase n=1 Tax=Mangrovimicrobium sediminis TaxID=2562682 RepID=A0A4Z0M6L2_9GAMM|nr:class I adenylate-forming enzyme family protein [Haliea sp. SAOS-164]TGD75303.1 long-chain fatty acid--CoA ligase [Haliea sp. SAOS-164]
MSGETYQPGVPETASTFPQFIRAIAAAYGDAVAVRFQDPALPEETITFAALERESARLARALLARGAGKGTRIGFIAANSVGFVVQFCAIARIGAIAVPLSTLLKSHDLVRVLRQSDVTGLIVQRQILGKDYAQRVAEALPGLYGCAQELRLTDVPFLRWVVSDGDDLPQGVRARSWLLAEAESVDEALLEAVEAEIYPTDQVMEIYTSGSMAMPKGVKHNHGAVLARTHFLRRKLPLQSGQEYPALMPMFWVGGLMMYLLPNLAAGAATLCAEATLRNSRYAMGSVLAEGDEMRPPEGWPIWALGMTETIGPYSWGDEVRVPGYPLCPPLDHIADGFEVRVADENDQPVAEGERGEIQVRGYALTPGLHKLEREGYFTADGYYHTGDMGERHGERILFVGRDGDMIKTASANVSPAEVEQEMQQLEGVHSAYVLGIPDQERGQLLVAAVVPRDGETVEPEALRAALGECLSSYKVPREYVVISREEVPLLPSNKVARRELEVMLAQRLGRA